MTNEKLEKALKLKEEIDDLKRFSRFLELLYNPRLESEIKMKGLRALFRCRPKKSLMDKHEIILSDRLTEKMVSLILSELKCLEDEYEKL